MPVEEPFVNRHKAAASYRPKGYGISPGLRRARRPFLIRNIVTGTLIAGFSVGIWAYSIRAVQQDVFDDVDAEAQSLSPTTRAMTQSIEDQDRAVQRTLSMLAEKPKPISPRSLTSNEPQRGILPAIGRHYPRIYDPSKTLVWGAPPVDNLGSLSDKPDV